MELATTEAGTGFQREFPMTKRKQKGFTLIELMIVVAIIGILAAIAIPAFIEYINSGKGTESDLNLNKIAKSAKIYRQKNASYPTGTQAAIPATDPCALANGVHPQGTFAALRDDPGPFMDLDFVIGDAFRYSYAYDGGGADYTASAIGNLDCDATSKTALAIGTVDPQGNPETQFSSDGTD